MTDETNGSMLRRILDRVFPKVPDFFQLLADQCGLVSLSVSHFVRYMQTGDAEAAAEVKKDEHDADKVKARNIHLLNEAFATPIDREDIYRAITSLDEVVNYCKTTVSEMDVLGMAPDPHMVGMAQHIQEGTEALVRGFAVLKINPVGAFTEADAARKAERRVEKAYRRALADLFQGEDYLGMFKRREIYRHISNCADRMADAANTLHDIVVKIS